MTQVKLVSDQGKVQRDEHREGKFLNGFERGGKALTVGDCGKSSKKSREDEAHIENRRHRTEAEEHKKHVTNRRERGQNIPSRLGNALQQPGSYSQSNDEIDHSRRYMLCNLLLGQCARSSKRCGHRK